MGIKRKPPSPSPLRVSSKEDGNQLIDLKGIIFGHLLVKKKGVTKSSNVTKDLMGGAYWLCLCDLCKCIVSIRSYYLRNGYNRMCGDCAIAARKRFLKYVKELERKINNAPEQQPEARMKRLKRIKVPPGTINAMRSKKSKTSYTGQNAIEQVRPLRDANTSLKDIASLLNITIEEVKAELVRTRKKD